MQPLDHRLDRIIVIEARPDTVFSFFTDSERWAQWWGAGSTIDPRPGGGVYIRYSNGIEVRGEVLDIRAPESITFTYGYVSGRPFGESGSRVTIRLEPLPSGTRLHLSAHFADEDARQAHVQGWRYQLTQFAKLIADVVHADAPVVIDGWFAAWNEADEARRHEGFARVAEADVEFRDPYGFTTGLDDLLAHVAAVHRFMPGLQMRRRGDVRQCHGRALSDWVAVAADGTTRGEGTDVFVFGPEGRIASVTGFWNPTGTA